MIPVYQPSLTEFEKQNVLECLDSTWISSQGKFVVDFEKSFAEYVGSPYSISVCNGTAALHLALLALGVGPGDEIIVPTLTYIASVNAITYTGAVPVFVDSHPDTWQMDIQDVEKKMTSKTRAVLAVHLYGYPCELDDLYCLTEKNKIYLIEDCAEATGTYYMGKHVGNWGHIATFSFYGNKTITTGEGGMLVTADEYFANRIRRLKGQGLADNREYWHDIVGYNYRMTNICAALGVAQLQRIETILDRKRVLAENYHNQLKSSPVIFQKESEKARHSYWMVSLLVPHSNQRDRLRDYLSVRGVETRPVFYPIHQMPIYFESERSFPIAENLGSRGITLPSWPDLESKQIDYICQVIEEFFSEEK